jgi:hypothetical protein
MRVGRAVGKWGGREWWKTRGSKLKENKPKYIQW